jgi:hypothetical protein
VGTHRRAVWLFRLLVYPAALGLIAMALHQRAAADDAQNPFRKRVGGGLAIRGWTSQGELITALVRDGRLIAFDTHLRCAVVGDPPKPAMRLRWAASVPAVGNDGVPTFRHGETTWQLTWRSQAGLGHTIVSVVPAVNTPDPSPDEAPRPGATSIVVASVKRDRLIGMLTTTIAVPIAAPTKNESCWVAGVRFSLPT